MIKSNIDVIVNNSCCCALSTYRTVVLKCNMIGNDNVLTQDMIETPYTKYVIKYDYIIDPNPIVGVANIDTLKEDCCSGKTYYYWRTLISLRKGQSITIPKGCVLLNSNLTAELDIVAADKDIDVYIASEIPGSYNYKILLSLIIPEKCIIQFDGGSISNGTLVGNKTILLSFLKNENVLKNVELNGTFTNVFEIQEEVITKQPGEKIIPVYKRITLRSGREKVAFNVCSFEIQDIDRIIRFDYGGSQPYEITLSKGQNSFRFPTAEELGFDRVLEGWYTKDNDWVLDGNGEWWSSTLGEHRYNPGEEYIIPEGVEELKFYVHWLCSVTFVSLYGSVPTFQTLNLGEYVSLSPITLSEPTESDPTNPYYTTKFEGWYLDLNYTNKVLDLQYLLTLNVTFYAKWNTNIITVRFYFKYIGRFGLIKEEVIDRDKNEQVQVPTVADSIDYTLEYVKYWVYKNNPNSIAITEGQTTWLPSGEPKLIEVYAVRALNLQFNPDGGSVNLIRVTVNHNNQSKSITVGENINTEDIYVSDKLIFDAYSGTKLGYKLSENSDFYWPSTEIEFFNNELTIDEDTIEDSDGVLVISPHWVTDSITLTWKDVDGTTLKQDNVTAGKIVLLNYLPTRGNYPNNNSYLYIGLNGTYVIYKRIEKEIEWITGGKAELSTATGYVRYVASTAYWKINGNEVDLSLSITITGNTEIVLGFKDPEFTTNNLSVILDTFKAPSLIIDANSEYSFKGWMDEDNNTFDNFNSITNPSYFNNHSEVFTALWESNIVSLTFKAPKCTYLSLGDGFGTYTLDEDNTDAEMELVNSRKYYCAINKDLKVTVKVPKTKSDGSSTEIHLPYAYRLYKFYVHKRGEENPTVVSGYLDNLYMNLLTSWRITNIDGRSVANVLGDTLEDLGANTSVVFEQQYSIDGWNPLESYILNRLNTLTGKDGNYLGWYLENGTRLVEETTTTTIYRFVDKIKAAFNDNNNYGNNLDYNSSSSPSWSLKFHIYDYDSTASVSYALTTTIPSDFGSLDESYQIPSGEVLLSSLQGWNNWEGQNDLYILIDTVKTESGNIVTDASKYITLKDASGNPGLENSFTCTINNSIVSLKWDPAFPGPLDNSTHGNYKIIFK